MSSASATKQGESVGAAGDGAGVPPVAPKGPGMKKYTARNQLVCLDHENGPSSDPDVVEMSKESALDVNEPKFDPAALREALARDGVSTRKGDAVANALKSRRYASRSAAREPLAAAMAASGVDDAAIVDRVHAAAYREGLIDGDIVELRGHFKRNAVCIVKINDDVRRGHVLTCKSLRKSIKVNTMQMAPVRGPYAPVNAATISFQVLGESVEGLDTSDADALIDTFLVPHFANFFGGSAARPVIQGDYIICPGQNSRNVIFKASAVTSHPTNAAGKTEKWGQVQMAPHPQGCRLVAAPSFLIEDAEFYEEINKVGYADVGGLKEQLVQIRENIELPIRHPKIFKTLGMKPPKGVLMHGPPGCGKTLIAKAIANECGVKFLTIAGPEIISGARGESEANLRTMFAQAAEAAPSILFIDEIDSIAPNRDKGRDENMQKIVATLLTLMDGIKSKAHIMVIGATNRPNAIDPALRRAGRFDAEICIPVPSRDGRREILEIVCENQKHADDVDLDQIADDTHGFVGADLANLASKAAVACIRREALHIIDWAEEDIPPDFIAKLRVTAADFAKVMITLAPSSTRDVQVTAPTISFADIGGLTKVKEELKEMVSAPVKYRHYYADIGVEPPRGALMYGPPGVGKTMLAKAMANECSANFISIKGPQLMTKWFGETEQNVREVFEKARNSAPCILFFDELDSIAKMRGAGGGGVGDRVVNQLLTEMDGVGARKNIFIVGATNRPEMMDSAIMRPGRLDQLIYIPLPDIDARRAIFQAACRKSPVSKKLSWQKLAAATDGYSGADINSICQLAVKLSVRERITKFNAFIDENYRADFEAKIAEKLAAKAASRSAAADGGGAAASKEADSGAPPVPPAGGAAATPPRLPISRLTAMALDNEECAAELTKRFGAYDKDTGDGWQISVSVFAAAFGKVTKSVSAADAARYRAMRDRFQEQVKGGAGGALATKEFDSGELEGLYLKESEKATAMRTHRAAMKESTK